MKHRYELTFNDGEPCEPRGYDNEDEARTAYAQVVALPSVWRAELVKHGERGPQIIARHPGNVAGQGAL